MLKAEQTVAHMVQLELTLLLHQVGLDFRFNLQLSEIPIYTFKDRSLTTLSAIKNLSAVVPVSKYTWYCGTQMIDTWYCGTNR